MQNNMLNKAEKTAGTLKFKLTPFKYINFIISPSVQFQQQGHSHF